MSRLSFVVLTASVLAASVFAACTPSQRGSGNSLPPTSSSGSRAITREMIAKWNVLDAYDAIERGGMYKLSSSSGGKVGVTQRRGQTSLKNANADHPVLLLDGAMMRDFDMLRQIRAAEIERIDFLSPADAAQRFGTSSAGAGAIIVRTRGGG